MNMRLIETSVKWGNGYNRYYFLNGKRISESYATYILKHHCYEKEPQERIETGWRLAWNIGPRIDAHSLIDHPDMI